MIPPFMDGVLPPGIHAGTWTEVKGRFGWNAWRRLLLVGLRSVLDNLTAAGCGRAWLDGSFVTEKERPNDFDLVWETSGVSLDDLDPVLLDLDPPRRSQKLKYGGDVLPNVVEGDSGMPFLDFFQQDSVTGAARGIVEMNLEVRQ